MTICITCGLDSERVSDMMPRHLLTFDSDGQPHWIDCKSHIRHMIANPDLYNKK